MDNLRYGPAVNKIDYFIYKSTVAKQPGQRLLEHPYSCPYIWDTHGCYGVVNGYQSDQRSQRHLSDAF